MEVRVCRNCRRLFNYTYGPEICPECTRELVKLRNEQDGNKENLLTATLMPNINDDEDRFEQVRNYIMANPKATVAKIAEDNGISPGKLFEWIRDDRLEFSDDSSYAWFECERCGARIRSGRLCNRCKLNR